METLTIKQKQVFDFIARYIAENGIPPCMEEIRKELRLRAVSTIHEHINTLIDKDYLMRNGNSTRNIYPTREIDRVINIPIVGYIAAGYPIEAIEEPQSSVSLVNSNIKHPKDYYALKVSGDSMIDEGIFDGDVVVIKRQSSAENGQTVVAIIDDNRATLKKLYRESKQFRLEPANQAMLPFYRDEVEVRGVVTQIIRNVNTQAQPIISPKQILQFRTIDLFAGIGGIRIGFERAGFTTVFSNDFDQQCKITYDANFPTSKLVVEDITKIDPADLPDFEYLLAGFPCQPFSVAGYQEGFNDKRGRGNLFFYIARIIKERQPVGFLLENVKNLKGHDGGKTFSIIEKTLEDLGYHIQSRVLNTMEYGNIPQNRERIYIVGFKKKIHADRFEFPKMRKLANKVTDLLENNISDKYYYNGKPLYEKIKSGVVDEGKVYQWRRKYVRENKSNVCPTLTANMGMGGHNVPIIKDKKGIRKLTPTECARLQGFPKDYVLPPIADSALYKQIGNSVSVPVVEAVAKEIRRAVGN